MVGVAEGDEAAYLLCDCGGEGVEGFVRHDGALAEDKINDLWGKGEEQIRTSSLKQ